MKDSEFIELLNLYVDHEISAADAVRLEAEVQANPARRETYQQYCRMQKACKLLAGDFQTAPDTRKVVAFEAPRHESRVGQFAAFGALAAAACVAFVFVNRTPQPTAPSQPVAATETVRTQPIVPNVQPERTGGIHLVSVPTPQAVPVSGNPLLLSNQAQADVLRASNNQNLDPRFQWMTSVRFSPIQSDILRFDAKSTIPNDAVRVYTGPRPLDPQVESAAFKFNK